MIDRQTWKVGAIYRMASRRGFDRPTTAELLRARAGLSEVKAQQLASIWHRSKHFLEAA